MPARTRRFRQRSIRELLSLIVVVPCFCLLALWAVLVTATVVGAVRAHNFVTAEKIYGGPGQALYSALTAERLQAFVWLSGGRQAAAAPLQVRFLATDRAAAAFLAAVGASRNDIPAAALPALASFESALAGRTTVRAGIATGQLTAAAAFDAYNTVMAAESDLDARLVVTGDGSLYRQAAATVQATRAVEMANQELALLHGAVAAGGTMTAAERVQFAQDVAGQRVFLSAALSQLEPSLGGGYQRLENAAAYRNFAAIEDQIAGSPGPAAVSSAVLAVGDPLTRDYQAAGQQAQSGLAALAAQSSRRQALAAMLVGVLGLAAVAFSMYLMIRFGLQISRGLIRLRDAALHPPADEQSLADQPGARPEDDAATGSPPDEASPILEIASISAVLSAARSEAARAEVGRAQLHDNTKQAVLNLAARSQALLRRQQALLETLQRSTDETTATPAEVSAVDQLTARLRRHSDGLLVLSGSSPGRSWPGPVPISDLLGVVATDVADVAKVSVAAESADEVTATVTADVVHLIGELVASAAQHAPPEAEITIRAGRVGRGVAVEIEDRSAELTTAELDRVNAMLASPPESDLVETDRIGYVIAARLAAKHRITVTLRSSPLGGTTTILVLPHALLVAGSDRDTIIDGSLPRIDVDAQHSAVTSQQIGHRPHATEAVRADSRVAPYVAADEEAAAATSAPWYWLTASPPTPPPLDPDPPLSPTGSELPPGPLPRRVRHASAGPQFRHPWSDEAAPDRREGS